MTENVLRIRAAAPGDLPFILDLGTRTVAASVSAVREAVDDRVLGASYAHLVAIVHEAPHRGFVAEHAGERAGFCLLLDEMPDEVTELPQGFLAYMAVEPALHRRGIGSALLRAAEAATRERGRRYLALMVTEENAAARALYAGAGYRTERRYLCKVLD